MNYTLICPTAVPAVPALSRQRPLVLAPFLGRTVLEHALAGLAANGAKVVRLLAEDRLPEIQAVVGAGQAWGLQVVFLSPREGAEILSREVPPGESVMTLDHLPQAPERPLWDSYQGWYEAQLALLPAFAAQRVGMREVTPGVFADLRSQIAGDASLVAPCWIGSGVFVGSQAVVGPGSIIEDGSYLDSGAEIVQSIVGPQTYVGSVTEIRGSFAWGSELLHLESGSLAQVTDRFLLSEMRVRSGFAAGLAGIIRGIGNRGTAPDALANPPGLARAGGRFLL